MPELAAVLGDVLISRLAREVARNLVPIERIQENYKITQAQFEDILLTPFFQTRLAEELELWNASDSSSITKRIGAKAATMIEESLTEVYALIHDRLQPMPAKIEALKWASRMAGIGEGSANVKGSPDDKGVKITINIGDRTIAFDKERVLPSTVIEGESVELTPDVVR